MAEGTLACEEPRASSLSNGINIAGHPYVPAGEPAPGHTLMSGKATVCVFSGLRVENTDKGPGQCHRASEEAPRPDLGSQGACPKDPGDGPSAAQRRSWRPGREGEHVRHCAPALALSLPRGHRHRGNTSLPHPPAADGKRMGSGWEAWAPEERTCLQCRPCRPLSSRWESPGPDHAKWSMRTRREGPSQSGLRDDNHGAVFREGPRSPNRKHAGLV